jgi:hypothetical protein
MFKPGVRTRSLTVATARNSTTRSCFSLYATRTETQALSRLCLKSLDLRRRLELLRLLRQHHHRYTMRALANTSRLAARGRASGDEAIAARSTPKNLGSVHSFPHRTIKRGSPRHQKSYRKLPSISLQLLQLPPYNRPCTCHNHRRTLRV